MDKPDKIITMNATLKYGEKIEPKLVFDDDDPQITWHKTKEHLPPNDKQFIAAWMVAGELDGIEWYCGSGEDFRYWNLNSNNLNEFEPDYKRKSGAMMFTHWAHVEDFNWPVDKDND